MIQFKADCGHTIEVSDREAGQIVRCAYCGREVEAPCREEQDPALLFEEVDLNELAKDEGITADQSLTIQGQQRSGKASPFEETPQTGKVRVLLMGAYVVFGLVLIVLAANAVINFASTHETPDGGQLNGRSAAVPLNNLPDADSRTARSPEVRVPPVVMRPAQLPPGEQAAADPKPAIDDQPGTVVKEAPLRGSGQRPPWGPHPAADADSKPGNSEHEPDVQAAGAPATSAGAPPQSGRHSPWDHRSSNPSTVAQPRQELRPEDVLEDFTERLRKAGTLSPTEWNRYLADGPDHRVWQAADIRSRAAFIGLMDAATAGALIRPLGAILLNDPGLDVRLSVLAALVRTQDKAVISFIDARLEAIEQNADINPDEARAEIDALQAARDALSPNRARRNPWKK